MFKTELERKMFKRICHLKMAYLDSNPDVGMGPSQTTVVIDEAESLGIKLSREEARQVANKIWTNY